MRRPITSHHITDRTTLVHLSLDLVRATCASEALITAQQTILMNCSSDIMQTLVNAHKLSSNTQTRKLATHLQDESDSNDPQ